MTVWMVIGLTCVIAVLWWVPPDYAQAFIREGGPEERATALGYGVVLAAALCRFGWRSVLRHWALALVPIMFMMRELDFDKRFTSAGIFTSRLYLRAGVGSLGERMFGLAVILLLVWWATYLVIRYGRDLRAGGRRRAPSAVWIGVVAALALLAYALDGWDRKTRKIGLRISPASEYRVHVVEETLELGIPLAMLGWIRAIGRDPRNLRAGEDTVRLARRDL